MVWVFPEPGSVTWLAQTAETTIGRDSSCTVCLPSQRLSRCHARVRSTGALWVLEDLASRNGVSVNGRRIERTVLAPGDIVRLGDWIAAFLELPPHMETPFVQRSDGMLEGPASQELLRHAEVLARGGLSIVLEGETGTGKELYARVIHRASGRSGPFVAVNCAVYQKGTASAELFGYRRGAFTGADRAHEGHIQAANFGTLFLDEVADLELELQAQLLRAVQEGEVTPLGESRPVRVDVRFVSALQRPLADEVARGRFRADLRGRLEGAVLRLPPLRERREEIIPLFLSLLQRELGPRAPRLDAKFAEWLALREWSLNVRELEQLARKLALLHPDLQTWSLGALERDLPLGSADRRAAPSEPPIGRRLREEHVDQEALKLVEALRQYKGNLTRAAAALNMNRTRAYRLLSKTRARED